MEFKAQITPVLKRDIDEFKNPPEQHGNNDHAQELPETVDDQGISSQFINQGIYREYIAGPHYREIPVCKWLDFKEKIHLNKDYQ